MSTLGNQLAALSSSKGSASGAGIIHSTSRTNNDGIGRGFHHSNRHGHAIITNNNSTTNRQPSILYDNARDAADVTLSTLHENALAAMTDLSSLNNSTLWKDADFLNSQTGLLSLHNLNNFERGTSTSRINLQVDKAIEKLLKLIMTMLVECPDSGPSTTSTSKEENINSNNNNPNPMVLSCLHIIEYLLRKYDIHAIPSTGNMLLQTFLPYAIISSSTIASTLFARILSLIDLTTTPIYTFLRPYAARDAPPLNRTTLAKHVAKNDALVHVIKNVGVCAMEVSAREQEGNSGSSGSNTMTRRGISTLLSFSASILIEAMHIQSSSNNNNMVGGSGGVQESMIRILFPTVLSACKSNSSSNSSSSDGNTSSDGSSGSGSIMCCPPEWKEWGRLLASTICMVCTSLSHDVKVAFCDAIVDGLPSMVVNNDNKGKQQKKKKLSFMEAVTDISNDTAVALSSKEAEDASSDIMTLLSILATMTNVVNKEEENEEDEDDGFQYYLPILPPKKKRRNIIDYMGCELPPSTYKRLSKEYSPTAVAKFMGSILITVRADNDDSDEDVDEDDMDVDENPIIMERLAPLVASIIMHAFARMEKEAGKVLVSSTPKKKKSKSKTANGGEEDGSSNMKCKADRDVLLILSLVSFLPYSYSAL